MVTSAWWVESHQVSKTAPTGEYLTVGSFMIRGKKNFLPPSQLEMGLGVLFRLGDDDSILRHKNERRDFALMQLDEDDGSTLEDDISPVVIKRVEKKVELPSKPRVSKAVNLSGSSAETNGALPTEKSHLDSPAEEPPETIDDNLKVDHFEESQHIISPGRSGDADQNVTSKTDASLSKKKGLSVKERKLIKKYGSLEAAKAIEEERQRQDEAMDDASETSSVASQQTSQPGGIQTKHKRGKKTKMKRVAKKYADQDDDDRELALLLLQGGEKEKHKDKRKVPLINEREKEAAAETLAILTKDSAAIAAQLPEKVRDTLAKCVAVSDSNDGEVVKWGKFDGDVLEQLQVFELEEQMQAAADRLLALKGTSRIDNFSASLAGIIRTIKKYGHEGLNNGANGDSGGDGRRKNKSEKEAEEESWKKTLADEGILDGGDEDDEGVDDTAEISKLTGKPQNEDLLLFAVPVCAPYQTLSQYAYRVKLTPGNMKRGKASKQCVDMFLKDGAIAPGTDRYRELIKKVLDNEWVQSICGDVKISAAGAAKAIQKSKAKVKGGKKK
ncbi:RNA-binding protein [Nitzschia inconspicua]|nr:RNA-binding protein [Nitzschia inconspicua]